MKTTIQTLAITLLLVSITSCELTTHDPESTQEAIVGLEDISSDEINTRLQIIAPDGWNTFTIDDTIALIITNNSDQEVRFNANDDIRIFFEVSADEWMETQNIFFDTRPYIVILPKDVDQLGASALVSPVITQGEPVNIRIVVVAIVYQDDLPTSTETGAFIDLTISP